MNKRLAYLGIVFVVVALIGLIVMWSKGSSEQVYSHNLSEGKLSADAKQAKATYEKSLAAINDQDMTTYRNCLVSEARKASTKSLELLIKTQNLKIKLEGFEVLSADNQHMLVKISQITQGKDRSKDNRAVSNVTFDKQGQDWYIAQAKVIQTYPL